LLHNPEAGDEDHPSDELIDLLEAAGHLVSWQSVKERDWQCALQNRVDLVAVAGGDGTVQKTFGRLLAIGVPVTLLPLGSANNIARSLGFHDDDPEHLIAGWSDAETRPCDVMGVEGGGESQLFVEAAGGGIFAAVLQRAADASDDLPADEKVEYGLHLLRDCLDTTSPERWELQIDVEKITTDLVALELMNTRSLGPNIPLAPDAEPGDGMVDIVLISSDELPALRDHVEARLWDEGSKPLHLSPRRAERVRVRLPPDHPLHVDDQIIPARGGEPRWLQVASAGQITVLVPSRQKR
jgi:diacylglycerol kinase family enzyme